MNQDHQKKSSPRSNFKVFVDEHSPDDIHDVQQQWRQARKKQKNKQLTYVLIGIAIAIGLIFGIMLKIFMKHQANHQILDDSDPLYTYLQTSIPHLKVLVDKQSTAFQSTIVKAIGIYQAELISWIQGNIANDMKVLYLPNQQSGVNLVGVALGYYVRKQKGGRVGMVIGEGSFREMTIKNMQKMQIEHGYQNNYDLFKQEKEAIGNYQLLIVESPSLAKLKNSNWSKFDKIVIAIRDKQAFSYIQNNFNDYAHYQIGPPIADEIISKSSRRYGYSIRQPFGKNKQGGFDYWILTKRSQFNVNLCPENVLALKKKGYLRNLVEYVRNKTVGTIYYGLEQKDQQVFQCIKSVRGQNRLIILKNDKLNQQLEAISSADNNIIILQYRSAQTTSFSLTKGVLLVEVSSEIQKDQIMSKYRANSSIKILSMLNNDGCYYPPQYFSQTELSPPYFVIIQSLGQQQSKHNEQP